MRRLAPFAVALVSLLVAASAEANPSPKSFLIPVAKGERVLSPEAAREVLVRSAALSTPLLFAAAQTVQVGDLTIHRFKQTHAGLPVYGRAAAIVSQPDGRVVLATARLETRLPTNTTPSLSPAQAAQVASQASGIPADPQLARLWVWPGANGARLVYVLRNPAILPVPYVPVVVLDAHSGEVIARANDIRFKNQAKLHKFNPVSTPDTTAVTLNIPDPNTTPDNEDALSFNCVDTKSLKPVTVPGLPSFNLHVCDLASKSTAADAGAAPGEAYADIDGGDYLQYQKVDDTSGGDPFAQLSIFYHVTQAYDYFRGFQADFKLSTSKKAWPLYLVANVMLPQGLMTMDMTKMTDPNLPFEPFSNAFYTGWDDTGYGSLIQAIAPEIKGAALAFGQGNKIDYSYDGDVVFHEFGHAVVDSTASLIFFWRLDSQGASHASPALSEALADYYSGAITGEPNLAEYACQDQDSKCKFMRQLTNDKTCPKYLTGEEHADSEFYSAAMWVVRETLASDAEKKTFDQTLFATLNAVPSGDLGYEDLSNAFVTALEQSTLGKTVADKMKTEFTDRGVLPSCHRLYSWEGTPIQSQDADLAHLFAAPGLADFATAPPSGYAPGLFQIKVPIPAGSTSLKASFMEYPTPSQNPLSPAKPFKPAFLVSYDKEIQFSLVDYTANTTTVIDAASGTATSLVPWSATFELQAGAKEAYVMVVNKSESSSMYYKVAFTFTGQADAGVESGTEDATVPQPDASEDVDAGETPPATTPAEEEDDGCGCRMPGSSRSVGGTSALLLGLASLLMARRRR